MDKISEAFESFKNFDIYQDLNYNNPDASYLQLGKEKEFHLNKFVHEDEIGKGVSEYYRQLSLTEYNGYADNIKPNNKSIATYKASTIKNSKKYNPVLDERNYTKRKDICSGYWNTILDTFKSPVTRTRFAFLAPNHKIKPHIDYNTTYSIRIHIPIITNPDSYLCAYNHDGTIMKHHCPADGGVWFLNTGMMHWAENNGSSPRIHLIISLNGQDDLQHTS
jgi:hypothetical protein